MSKFDYIANEVAYFIVSAVIEVGPWLVLLFLLRKFLPRRKPVVLGGIFLCVVTVLAAMPEVIPGYFKGEETMRWDVATETRPVRIQIINGIPQDKRPLHEVYILYKYAVGDTWYRGDKYNVLGNLRLPAKARHGIDAGFVLHHQVRFNPDNPAESVLAPGIALPHDFELYVVAFSAGLFIISWGAGLGSYENQDLKKTGLAERILQYGAMVLCAVILGEVWVRCYVQLREPDTRESGRNHNYRVPFEEHDGSDRVYHVVTRNGYTSFPFRDFVETTSVNERGEEIPITRKTWIFYGPARRESYQGEPYRILEWTPDRGIHQLEPEDDNDWLRDARRVLPEELRPR